MIESNLINEFRVLDPTEWPTDIETDHRENEIESLYTRFNLITSTTRCINAFRDYIENGGKEIPEDLQILIHYINTIPCSSPECERGFSNMNIILNEQRNTILIENLANLLFIKMNGPLQQLFNPDDYVKILLRSRHSADDNKIKKVQPKDPE
uniref:Dimer_Tnp_hAT domain-containing protein n=1 Tax=Rhodnius prolixus TaxID=13249 RepID=T1HEH8_RHOPR